MRGIVHNSFQNSLEQNYPPREFPENAHSGVMRGQCDTSPPVRWLPLMRNAHYATAARDKIRLRRDRFRTMIDGSRKEKGLVSITAKNARSGNCVNSLVLKL